MSMFVSICLAISVTAALFAVYFAVRAEMTWREIDRLRRQGWRKP